MATRLITLIFLASAIISSGQSEPKCSPTIAENVTENVLCIEFFSLACLNNTFNLTENITSCLPEDPKFCINQLCSNDNPNLTSSETSIPTSTSICGSDDEQEIQLTISWSVSGILLVSCTVLNLILLWRLVTLKKQYQQQLQNTNIENNYEMTSTEYTMVQQQNNPSNNTLQAYSIPSSSKNETKERQIIKTSGKGEEVVDSAKEKVAQADNTSYATVNKPTVSRSTFQDDPTPPTYAVVNKQAPPIPMSMYDCLKLEHQ